MSVDEQRRTGAAADPEASRVAADAQPAPRDEPGVAAAVRVPARPRRRPRRGARRRACASRRGSSRPRGCSTPTPASATWRRGSTPSATARAADPRRPARARDARRRPHGDRAARRRRPAAAARAARGRACSTASAAGARCARPASRCSTREFAERVRPWPQIAERAVPPRRAARRPTLDVLRAISCQPRLEVRLVLLLWHLAARWGRVEPTGIRLSLPLTHRLLGQLVAAERPSISHALRRLSEAGLVTGTAGDWHLHGTVRDASGAADRAHRAPRRRARRTPRRDQSHAVACSG